MMRTRYLLMAPSFAIGLALPAAAQADPAPVNRTRAALDANSDGRLSAAEIADATASLLALDADGDGTLSGEELGERRSRGRGRGGFGRFGRGTQRGNPLDTDRNGALSEQELRDASAELRRLDGNRDGSLSARELSHVFKPPSTGGFPMGGFGRGGGGVTERIPPDELEFKDGVAAVPDHAMFRKLSYRGPDVLIDTHLRNIEYVKFQIEDVEIGKPLVYWINTETHRSHPGFMRTVGISMSRGRGGFGGGRGRGGRSMRGVLCYRPLLRSPSGSPGLYTFEFEPNDAYPFAKIKLAHDMIVKTAPFMKGHLAYYPLPRAMGIYEDEKEQYEAAKLPVFLAEDLYKDIAFLPLHKAASYGRLRLMRLDERPGPRDIVLYETLPNEMPRVGGVITAARQTPLSHVNLRAIQDDVPNAFVLGAPEHPKIRPLIGKYVFYEVAHDGFELREATQKEVDAHFAGTRPREPQTPQRDLGVERVRPLDEIGFEDWKSVGVKAANVATLRKIGLPPGIVPDGYAVPFSFYDAFMRHNGLYEDVRRMRAEPRFASDADHRVKALAKLREKINEAEMPAPLTAALGEMQAAFAKGTSIRCRSSTNNEDLPGFSGAGLYDSCTQAPDGTHIAGSIKRVYASLWNFRAYEEREFFRIDHLSTAMGVLCHPNYSGELANGVGVTDDVVYQSENMFYLNTQVGEDMVTNPEAMSVPEEVLLGPRSFRQDRVVQKSNKAKDGKPLLNEIHMDELRECLNTIDREFRKLYGLSPRALFAMEIEFKVTAAGQVAIKQARPWIY